MATQQEDATEITDWATTWPLELQEDIHYYKDRMVVPDKPLLQ
jgi:hypothetical protein